MAGAASAVSGTTSSLKAKGLEEFPDDIISQLDDRYEYEEEDEDEEEETELKVEQHITLRIGVFFDGTGNNQTNSALTAECRRQDLNDFEPEEIADIVQNCNRYGYRDTNADGLFDKIPGDSFGNEASNIVMLQRIYKSDTGGKIANDAQTAHAFIYVDGIGTTTGSSDSFLGLALGKAKTGVARRVLESATLLSVEVRTLMHNNPHLVVDAIEFDVFGFSRGAAAARHFVNEVIKPGAGCLSSFLGGLNRYLSPEFDPSVNVRVVFVGLFDTVAGIANPLVADIDPGNDRNPGVNLYLPPGCAKQVVHLTSQDEHRHNFSLNRAEDISFPDDLRPIADKIIVSAMMGQQAQLTRFERQHLVSKYIHVSASWTPLKGFLVNRPRNGGRAVYPDRPQKGYPI